MSRSLFDDLDATPSGRMDSADARTLRLSAHPLTEAELEGLVRYQEAFLGQLERVPVSHGPDALVDAQRAGLEASGLDVKVVELGTSLLRAYGGQRWTARTVRERLAALEARASEDEAAREKAERARGELRRLEDLEPLARRYGQDVIDRLNAREEHLVALHSRMQRALTRG